MNLIPNFPDFKDIELSDKEQIKTFTSDFPPYADFNFSAMWAWSWDIKTSVKLSQLNNNLVVLFTDYVSGHHFLSFIGTKKATDTALTLIAYSKKFLDCDYLKLIPEEVASLLSDSEFIIEHDRDSYDYIYSVEELANMDKWKEGDFISEIKEFIKENPNYKINQSYISEIDKKIYLNFFEKWSKNKNIDNHHELNEFKAFQRFLENPDENISIISLYIGNELIGFNIFEILSKEYANSAFSKADVKHHTSIYKILNWEEAKILNKHKIKYYDWEQDLGIPGLRYSKEKYKPIFFLKKFIIKQRT